MAWCCTACHVHNWESRASCRHCGKDSLTATLAKVRAQLKQIEQSMAKRDQDLQAEAQHIASTTGECTDAVGTQYYCIAEPIAEPIYEIEAIYESIAEPIAEPVYEIEHAAEPIAETIAEPIGEPIGKPILEPIDEPVTMHSAITKYSAETIAEPIGEPIISREGRSEGCRFGVQQQRVATSLHCWIAHPLPRHMTGNIAELIAKSVAAAGPSCSNGTQPGEEHQQLHHPWHAHAEAQGKACTQRSVTKHIAERVAERIAEHIAERIAKPFAEPTGCPTAADGHFCSHGNQGGEEHLPFHRPWLVHAEAQEQAADKACQDGGFQEGGHADGNTFIFDRPEPARAG